jgi:hypothetical protein
MTLARALFIPLLLCLLYPLAVFSQAAPTVSMPKDPLAVMSLARDKNGLDSPDVRPWHIRGTYTFFDENGKPEDTGVYEEWWVSARKYKRSFTSPKFTQVEYATESGLFREGSQDWPSGYRMLLRSALIEPFPNDEILKGFKLEQHIVSLGKGKFDCVTLKYPLR